MSDTESPKIEKLINEKVDEKLNKTKLKTGEEDENLIYKRQLIRYGIL